LEEIEKSSEVKKLEEELRVNKLKNQIDTEKHNSFKNSIISKSLIGIFGIITFIVVTFVSLQIFSTYEIDKTMLPIFSIIAGAFTTYIIFIAGRIVKEFTIKGGTMELSTKLQEEIKNVQNDVKESKKEIEGVSKQIQQMHNIMSSKMTSEIYNGDVIQIGKEKSQKVLKKLKEIGISEEPEKTGLLEKSKKVKLSHTQRQIIEEDIDESEAYDKVIKGITGKSLSTYYEKLQRIRYFDSVNEYKKANELYDELLHEGHRNTPILVGKSMALYELGDIENAIVFLKEADKGDPDSDAIQNNLGLCHTAIGDDETARKYFKKAIEISPTARKKSNLASSYYPSDMKMFHKLIDEAYVMDPLEDAVLFWKGVSEIGKGNYDDAITHIDKISKDDPYYLSSMSTKGLALVLKGEDEMGLKLLNETLEKDPSNTEGLYEMAEAQSFLKNQGLALFYLKKSIQLRPRRKVLAKNDKLFDFIKDNKEFKKLTES